VVVMVVNEYVVVMVGGGDNDASRILYNWMTPAMIPPMVQIND